MSELLVYGGFGNSLFVCPFILFCLYFSHIFLLFFFFFFEKKLLIGYGKNNFSIAILKASDCWKRYDLHWSSLQLLSAYARLCSWRFSFPEDAFHIPGKIESTVGLFPDEDVTLHHPQIGDCCEDLLRGLLLPGTKRTRGEERKASSWCKKHLSDTESQ
ncbi:unnamed protein product [Brassica oleracea]